MRTSCPKCQSVYDIDIRTLQAAQGIARCSNCNTVFNSFDNSTIPAKKSIPKEKNSAYEFAELDRALEHKAPKKDPDNGAHLPFDIPDDLHELTPSDDAAIGDHYELERQPNNSPWWKVPLGALLSTLLIAQLFWFYRIELMQEPGLQPACEWIDCSEAQQYNPEAFIVIQREIKPHLERKGLLKLKLKFRNTAIFSQRYPDIQLALFDINETLLSRRRLYPNEYLFPAPAKGSLIASDKVTTIEFSFEDPGTRASGFKIDFL